MAGLWANECKEQSGGKDVVACEFAAKSGRGLPQSKTLTRLLVPAIKIMTICTIGFTKKTAEEFFSKLREAGVRRIVDVRLNNTAQLAGFSKRDDLKFFTREILGAEYVHLPMLAPTQEMLDEYRKEKRGWENYERRFRELMKERAIEKQVEPGLLDGGCLLCSEDKPHHCHRRIVAEYLREAWGNVEVVHL